MKTITVIGQGFTGAIMSIVCARAIKKKLYIKFMV